jgi:NAD(P)-dependent dehydrogenase (short-subunit alcohol dehydrogenase family)
MKAKGKGIIIFNSSICAFTARYNDTMYTVSKHAIAGMTKTLAWELGPEIRVNSVAPGVIFTRMVSAHIDAETLDKTLIKNVVALKRRGDPEEIASVALFLSTDASSYIDGQIIRVDGGLEV